MISTELTDIEKRFIKNWNNDSEIKYNLNFEDPSSVNIDFYRDLMRETAYHFVILFIRPPPTKYRWPNNLCFMQQTSCRLVRFSNPENNK